MHKRIAATLVVAALGGAQPADAAVPDLERTSATELAAQLAAGQLTSVELTKAYIDRIAAVNQRGPAINAVRSLNPEALREARVSDLARRTNSVRGPLEGLPILLKDNIDVAGMPTTASSIVLEKSVPDRDATIVTKLRAQGAVILGKVNLTEFAAYVSNSQQSGNGSLSGQVLNPYDLSTDPGGSSSGSGVAAAAGLAALTIGSDSEGSIISPATQNSVVGIRPSTGLWSRAGVVPISEWQDTLGPLVQTVGDAALLLNAVSGRDPRDPRTSDDARGDRLHRGPEDDRAAGRADRRLELHQRAVRRRPRRAGRAGRDGRPDPVPELPGRAEHPQPRVPARPHAVPDGAAGERAGEVLRGGL